MTASCRRPASVGGTGSNLPWACLPCEQLRNLRASIPRTIISLSLSCVISLPSLRKLGLTMCSHLHSMGICCFSSLCLILSSLSFPSPFFQTLDFSSGCDLKPRSYKSWDVPQDCVLGFCFICVCKYGCVYKYEIVRMYASWIHLGMYGNV